MLSEPRALAFLTLLFGLGVLGTALGFQYLGGLQPCVLCLYQRWPWGVAIVASLLALAVGNRQPAMPRTLLGLAAAALFIGAGIAAYHVGVEQQWWAGTAACGGVSGQAATVEDLKRQLMATEIVRCDEIAWSFAGISMAGWNMILSLTGAVLLVWGLFATPRSTR